ncbi:hypothetical protein N9W17_05865 [Jannaschia sp.]|nr:hypothetical protein [Jannaschia sp.]
MAVVELNVAQDRLLELLAAAEGTALQAVFDPAMKAIDPLPGSRLLANDEGGQHSGEFPGSGAAHRLSIARQGIAQQCPERVRQEFTSTCKQPGS